MSAALRAGVEVRRDSSWEPPWIIRTIYTFWQLLGRFVVFPFLFRVRVAGVERVPEEGSVIVASNHFTQFDPILTGSYVPRYLTFMAKREVVESPTVGWLCRAWGVLPVSRDGMDLPAVRQMLRILRSGQAMMMYPEGTRSRDGKLREPQPGAAYAAMKLGAPVIPVAIWGTEAFLLAAAAHEGPNAGEPQGWRTAGVGASTGPDSGRRARGSGGHHHASDCREPAAKLPGPVWLDAAPTVQVKSHRRDGARRWSRSWVGQTSASRRCSIA